MDAYPFLRDEIAILGRRLVADLPTLGVCLGAQLRAAALGAEVYRNPTMEISATPAADGAALCGLPSKS